MRTYLLAVCILLFAAAGRADEAKIKLGELPKGGAEAVKAMFPEATVTGAVVYVGVSLLTSRQPFNLDKMLHRGQYAIEADGGQPTMTLRQRFTFANLFKFDHNFTRIDKLTAGAIFWWATAMLAITPTTGLRSGP